MSSTGSSFHLPMPFPPDSIQVVGTDPAAGGTAPSNGGGTSGGSSGAPSGTSAAASALQFTASCQASDAVGNVVRSNGSASAVTTVTCSQSFPAVGIIIAKASATSCTVQTYGLCIGVVSGLSPNSRYYVGGDGKPATVATAFSQGTYIQLIGFAVASNALFVQPRGDLMQLAATRDAGGNDTTPQPPDAGSRLLYGGVLEGTDEPAADYGQVGDVYFRFGDSLMLYGPKSDAGWGAAKSLVGAAGNRIYVRHGPPDGSVTPSDGDLWYDQDSGTLYPSQSS